VKKRTKRKPRISPAMLAALAGPPPAAAGPPPGMGGPPPGPPMGMKKGGRVESRGDGTSKKGRTGTEMVKMAAGGSVRGGGCETKGRGRGRFV
jgi:hypothetical protein